MSEPCDACEASQADPIHNNQWTAGCEGCYARALAATGAHLESQERQTITPEYRKTLKIMFGARWHEGHERVSEWAKLIRMAAAAGKALAVKEK